MGPLLYSTNVKLKWWIQRTYRSGTHYVWCSEHFDSPPGVPLPPSANPGDIYRRLKDDITGKDGHSTKINEQRACLTGLALEWERKGEIGANDKEEILFKVTQASWDDWSPLIYIIPRALVESRMAAVPISQRAAPHAPEYIIADLREVEFDAIEL